MADGPSLPSCVEGLRAPRITRQSRQVREIGVERLLQWAFGQQLARIDRGDDDRSRHGTEWTIHQRGAVYGTKIDGGKGYLPDRIHEDAETVARVLRLVAAPGDIWWVMGLALTGTQPDWMPGAAVKVLPARGTKWKRRKRETAGEPATRPRWPDGWGSATMAEWDGSRRRIFKCNVCPVRTEPTWQEIDSARRDYATWWAILDAVRRQLSRQRLTGHRLTDAMPPFRPWLRDNDGATRGRAG